MPSQSQVVFEKYNGPSVFLSEKADQTQFKRIVNFERLRFSIIIYSRGYGEHYILQKAPLKGSRIVNFPIFFKDQQISIRVSVIILTLWYKINRSPGTVLQCNRESQKLKLISGYG